MCFSFKASATNLTASASINGYMWGEKKHKNVPLREAGFLQSANGRASESRRVLNIAFSVLLLSFCIDLAWHSLKNLFHV